MHQSSKTVLRISRNYNALQDIRIFTSCSCELLNFKNGNKKSLFRAYYDHSTVNHTEITVAKLPGLVDFHRHFIIIFNKGI